MATGPQRLFIGGLTSSTSKEEVEARLGKFGQLSDVKMVRKDSVKGRLEHCFAHLNFHGDAEQLKKLISTFHGTKWKGNTVKIEKAKPDFLAKLADERTVHTTAKPVIMPQKRSAEHLLENFQKAGVEDFTMKRAVPGTAIAGEKNWVVCKYGRVLPVVYLRTKDKRKVSKYDPSKFIHHLKHLKVDSKHAPKEISSLSWGMDDQTETHKSSRSTISDKSWGPSRQNSKRKGEYRKQPSPGTLKNGLDDHSVSSDDSSDGSVGANAKRRCTRPADANVGQVGGHTGTPPGKVNVGQGMERRKTALTKGYGQGGGRDETETESDRDSADTDEICTSKNGKKGSSISGMNNVETTKALRDVRESKGELDARRESGSTSDVTAEDKSGPKMNIDREILANSKQKTLRSSKQGATTEKGHSFKFFEGDSPASSSEDNTESESVGFLESMRRPASDKKMTKSPPDTSSSGVSVGDSTNDNPRNVSFNESVIFHQGKETLVGALKSENEKPDIDVDAILDAEKQDLSSADDIIASIVQEMKVKKLTPVTDKASCDDVELDDGQSITNKNDATNKSPRGENVRTGKDEKEAEVPKSEEELKSGAKDEGTGVSLKRSLISLSEGKEGRSVDISDSSDSSEDRLNQSDGSASSNDCNEGEGTHIAGDLEKSNGAVLKPVQKVGTKREQRKNLDSPKIDFSQGASRDRSSVPGSHHIQYSGMGIDFELLILDRGAHVKQEIAVIEDESHESPTSEESDSDQLVDDISSSESSEGERGIVVEEFEGMDHYRSEYTGAKNIKLSSVQERAGTKEKQMEQSHGTDSDTSEDNSSTSDLGCLKSNTDATGAVRRDKSKHVQSKKYSGNTDFRLLILDKSTLQRQADPNVLDDPNESAENGAGQSSHAGSSQESGDSTDESEKDVKSVVQEFQGLNYFRNRMKGSSDLKSSLENVGSGKGKGEDIRDDSDSSSSYIEDSSDDSITEGQQDGKGVKNLSNSSESDEEESVNTSGSDGQVMKKVMSLNRSVGNDPTEGQRGSIRGRLTDKTKKQEQVKIIGRDVDTEEVKRGREKTQQEAKVHKENGEIFGFHDNKYSGNADFEMLVLDSSVPEDTQRVGVGSGFLEKRDSSLQSDKGNDVSSSSNSDDSHSGDGSASLEGGIANVQEFRGMHHLRKELEDEEDRRRKPSPSAMSDSSDSDVDPEDEVDPSLGEHVQNSEAGSMPLCKGSDSMETGVANVKRVGAKAGERDADDETSSTESSDDMNVRTKKKKKKSKRRRSDERRSSQESLPDGTDVNIMSDAIKGDDVSVIMQENNSGKARSGSEEFDLTSNEVVKVGLDRSNSCEGASLKGDKMEEMTNDVEKDVKMKRREKRNKHKRTETNKEDSLKLANDRRLQAVKERREDMKAKAEAIKKALSSVDSVQKPGGEKKHMRFDSSSDEQISTHEKLTEKHDTGDKSSESTNQKQPLLGSSSDSSDSSEESAVDKNDQHSKTRKDGLSLFKDDDDEDSASDQERFRSKPQFEGEKGAKLLKLQDAFGDDPRFNLDERFAEEDSDDGVGGIKNPELDLRQQSDEEDGGAEGDLELEKAQSLSILENVLGVMLPQKRSATDEKKTKFRDVNQMKFDPSRADHSKFVLAPSESKPKKKKKSSAQDSAETPMPEVSKETFADFQSDLKSAFSQEQPVTFGFFSGEAEEETAAGKLDEDEVVSAPPLVLSKEKLPWDSSESEEEKDEGGNLTSERMELTVKPEQPPVATPTRSFFFRSGDDHRLKSGVSSFCRSEKGDHVDRWKETKTEILIASTKRHQKAVRDSQRMPKKRGEPLKRRRIGKKS